VIVSKINHNYKTTISVDNTFKKYCHEYNLVEINNNTIIECYYSWDTIKSILIDSIDMFSLFNVINRSHSALKCYNESGVKPPGVHLILDKLYNEFIVLCNCNSYEELIIKMDIIGI
jgi:hypothetical protein